MPGVDEIPSSYENAEARGQLTRLIEDVFTKPRSLQLTRENASWLAWNDGVVRRLAEAAYENRLLPSGELDPLRLAVLADSLEEAGGDVSLLNHLREVGAH